MKRVIAFMVAVLLCCTLALSVGAAENFVPSISYKDHPEVEGDPKLIDDEGELIHKLDSHCLEITAVSEAVNTPEAARTEEQKLLVEVYEKLESGAMKLPFEGNSADEMVIRDLFDASLVCGDAHLNPNHVEELAKPGVYIEITFDLGVAANIPVVAMVYLDGQWTPAITVANNGDGTVTCVFEELCPVAFCVDTTDLTPVPPTGDTVGQNLIYWFIMMVVAAGALILLLLKQRKNSK